MMLNFWRKYKVHIGTLLAFTFITFLFFPKLFTGFSSYVETNDGRLLAWTLSWDIHKLLTDPLHLFDANYFFPHKNNLCYSEHLIWPAVTGMPVWLLTNGNPAATFNFLMITGYVLNAFCSFLLIRKFVRNNAIAFLGAFINGFCSYRLINIAHLQNIIVFYIPLCLLFFYCYLDTKKLKYLIGVGVCLYLQSISSWYHMIFIFLLVFLLFLNYYFHEKRLTVADLKRFIITIGVVFVFIIPFALPYFKFNKENNSAFVLSDVLNLSADLGGYLIPPPYTFGNSVLYNYLGVSKTRWSENFNFIGYVALLFSLLGVFKLYRNENNKVRFRLQKQNLVFVFVAAVFMIFSLGPVLHLNDRETSLKLPYYLVFKLFSPIRFLRTVARYSTIVFLMTSILASLGLVNLLTNIQEKTYRRIVYGLIFILAVIEYLPVERFNRFSDMSNVPEVYQRIKTDADIKAIVELPINVGPFTTTKYLYYGGIHFKPFVNGYSGYEPPDYQQYKNTFDNPVNEFTSDLLTYTGVTHVLCNPEYKDSMDTAYSELIMQKEGYRLYKVKPDSRSVFYCDNIQQWAKINQTNDSTFQVKKQLNDVMWNPPGESMPSWYICPKQVNKGSYLIYTSNKPLHKAFIQFRAYSETDTLHIDCIKTAANNSESVVKSYQFVNSKDFESKYADLDMGQANKVVFKLYATVFPDRTLIKNVAFTTQK